MNRFTAALLALVLAAPLAFAQTSAGLKLSDIKAQGAKQLTVDEMRELLPGAKVKRMTKAGSTHCWENSADGTFVASSDGRGSTKQVPGRGKGNWHLADNGTYCVIIEWSIATDQWCRYLFKVGDKYYGASSVSNDAADVFEYEFSK